MTEQKHTKLLHIFNSTSPRIASLWMGRRHLENSSQNIYILQAVFGSQCPILHSTNNKCFPIHIYIYPTLVEN